MSFDTVFTSFILPLTTLAIAVIPAHAETPLVSSVISGCNLLLDPTVPCRPKLQMHGIASGTRGLLQSKWSLPSGTSQWSCHDVLLAKLGDKVLMESSHCTASCTQTGTEVTDENGQIWTVATHLDLSFATEVPEAAVPLGDIMQLRH